MIGWTLASLLTVAVLVGLTFLVKGSFGSWGKAAMVVAGITGATVTFVLLVHAVIALVKAGI